MAPERGSVIAKSNFPMYSVKSLDERHFLVAGGGGQAKTGVSNAIEIYELRGTETGYQASSVCAHDVGSQAPMNGATVYDGRNHLFAAGMDDELQNIGSSTEAVKRKSTKEETNGGANIDSNQTKRCLRTVKTDFLSDGGFQKCVQFSPDRSIIATGGGDGHLRIWKVVTISRGSSFSVWNVKDGKRHLDMEWPGKTGEHRFRACRFGVKAGSTEKGHTLYTINIPVKRSSKPDPCFIAQWDGETYKPRLVVNAGTEVLSSMAVSRDGIYVGVGMITGSVAVYIAFSLQKLYYVKEAHSIFVTGLDFMPTSENAREVTGTQDFHLLSISADNTIRLHQEPTRASYSAFILIIGLMMAIAFLFWTMAQLGL
ncbi:PREB-like protein [Mya arenaria]|uniref:PREB-like protein n=1 Tax=Mya arenaria TaxID=6604 RepID=A0ABY7FSR8_MYAAR|nr:PREB-like protein [Mya arenaria]